MPIKRHSKNLYKEFQLSLQEKYQHSNLVTFTGGWYLLSSLKQSTATSNQTQQFVIISDLQNRIFFVCKIIHHRMA
jgi:hypothetical protein